MFEGTRHIALQPARRTRESPVFDAVDVDLLRVRLELELPLPAVIAVTSATAEDGKELTARALAYSYALTGYSTLFIDTSLRFRTLAEPPRGIALTDTFARQSLPDSKFGTLAVLTSNDLTLRSTTSLRSMKAVFDILRGKFDVVVISTESGTTDAFAAAIVASADAVLVTVKKGRRKRTDDTRLASDLKRQGSRFLGIVALDPAIITANSPPGVVPVPEMSALGPPRPERPVIARVARAVLNRLRSGHPTSAAGQPPLALPEAAEPIPELRNPRRTS